MTVGTEKVTNQWVVITEQGISSTKMDMNKGVTMRTYIYADPHWYPRDGFEQKYVNKILNTNSETCHKNGDIEMDDPPQVWELVGNWGYFKAPHLILFASCISRLDGSAMHIVGLLSKLNSLALVPLSHSINI